jgi:hypothetical protein
MGDEIVLGDPSDGGIGTCSDSDEDTLQLSQVSFECVEH